MPFTKVLDDLLRRIRHPPHLRVVANNLEGSDDVVRILRTARRQFVVKMMSSASSTANSVALDIVGEIRFEEREGDPIGRLRGQIDRRGHGERLPEQFQ